MAAGYALISSCLAGFAAFLCCPAHRVTSTRARGAFGWQEACERWCAELGCIPALAWLRRRQDCQRVAAELLRCGRRLGWQMSLDAAYGLLVGATAASMFLTALVAASPVGLLVALGVAAAGVHVGAEALARADEMALYEQMPQVFRTLSVALASGKTLPQAISYVGSHEPGRAGAAFAQASLRLRCGQTVEQTLEQLACTLDAPGMRLLVSALELSQRTGSPLEGLLSRSARMVEEQSELKRTLEVKTAQARLSARIVCALPVLMICILALISEDFQRGLMTGAGALCVVVALAADAAALVIIRKLMKGVL